MVAFANLVEMLRYSAVTINKQRGTCSNQKSIKRRQFSFSFEITHTDTNGRMDGRKKKLLACLHPPCGSWRWCKKNSKGRDWKGEGCLLWLCRSTVATPQGSLPSSLFSDIFPHIFCSHQALRKHFIARCCQESTHVKINTTSFHVSDIRIPSSCPLQYSRVVAVFLCFCPRKLRFL